MSREAVCAALFARLAGLPGLATASRRLRHWSEVSPAEQPALFQVQAEEEVVARERLPPLRRIRLDLFLYVHTGGDPSAAPASLLNPLLDAIETALAPDVPGLEVQTLGGLCVSAAIDGRTETDQGALGDQAVAIVPVTVLLP